MPGQTHQKYYHLAKDFYVYQHIKQQLHNSFLSWYIAKTLHICYFEDFRHAWPHPSEQIISIYKKLQNFYSFCIVFMKKKKQNIVFLRPFMLKFGEKGFLHINQALPLFSIHSPLTLCKKSEKTDEPILRKTLN